MPTSDANTADHLEAFKTKIVAHPLLKNAFADLIRLVDEPAGASVATLIGPTGAGKSTLLDRVNQSVLKRFGPEMTVDPSFVPIVSVEAPSPEMGSFNWRDFYMRILLELKEPACDWQVALKERTPTKPGVVRLSSLNLTELRARVEAAFHHRGVKVLLIDEAQHVRKMASGRRLLDQMDALKSLASLSGAFVVLFGTYELLGLTELNGQLARRCVMVHLRRLTPAPVLFSFLNFLHNLKQR